MSSHGPRGVREPQHLTTQPAQPREGGLGSGRPGWPPGFACEAGAAPRKVSLPQKMPFLPHISWTITISRAHV